MSVSLLLISEDNEKLEIENSVNNYSSLCEKVVVFINDTEMEGALSKNNFSIVSNVNEFITQNSSDIIVITKVGCKIDLTKILGDFLANKIIIGSLYVDNYFKDEIHVSIDTYVEARLPVFINTSIVLKKKVFEVFDVPPECDMATFEKLLLARALVAGELLLVSNPNKAVNANHEIDMYNTTSSNILNILKSDLILIEEKKLLKGEQFQKLVDFIKLVTKLENKRIPNKLHSFILKTVLHNIGILKYIKNDIVGTVNYYLKDIINLLNYKYFKKEDVLFSFFTSKYPVHMNWGDDINYFILSKATNKKVIKLNRFSLGNVILPIGSIIQFVPKHIKVNIYGAGLISDMASVNRDSIDEIKFVRGPNTRNRLMKLGFDVPESYGDLGLLISEYYKPDIEKKFRIGFVPHYTEKNSNFTLYCKSLDIKIIDVQQDHKDFINDLLSCENIISSSLHGLIASDSYSIPNKWIKVSDRVLGDGFKFDDYHLGISAKNFASYIPNCTETEVDLINLCAEKRLDVTELARVKKKMQDYLHCIS